MSHSSAITPDVPASNAKTNRNLIWSGGSFLVTALLNFGTIYLLTQLLSPDAMALVFVSVIFQDLALLFVDNGMGSYIVQSEGLNRQAYSSLFYQVLIMAVLLTIGLSAMAPWLAKFFNAPPLEEAVRITAFSFICIALSFPQKGILQRHMHFQRIATAEFIGMLLAAAVTIWLAYRGFGFKSYLYGFLARKSAEALVLWQKEPWFPRPKLLLKPFQALFQYSAYASNALSLSYAVRLVDTLLVGRMLGIHTLGLYSLASNIIFFPVSKCVLTFSRVFLVNFSLAKHQTEQLRQAYAEAVGKLCLLLLPALCLLAITIPEMMRVFFKPAWLPVADMVRVMTLYGILTVFLRMGEAVLLALAKVHTVLIIYATIIVLTTVLLLLLIPHGAIGACWAVTLGAIPSCWLLIRTLNTLNAMDWPLILQRLRPGFLLALGLAMAVWLIRYSLMPHLGRPAFLVITAGITTIAYAWTYRQARRFRHPDNTADKQSGRGTL